MAEDVDVEDAMTQLELLVQFPLTELFKYCNPEYRPDLRTIERINIDTEPINAFQILFKKKLRAAPIWNPMLRKYEGVLDCRDVVKYAVSQHEFLKRNQRPVANLRYICKMRTFCTFDEKEPLAKAMDCLARGHHLVGVKVNGIVERILGQTQIFEFLRKKSSKYLNFPIDNILIMGFVGRTKHNNVALVTTDTKCCDAFEQMSQMKQSSLVIYENSKPVGVLSSTDIRIWLESSNCDLLELPVSYCLHRQQSSNKNNKKGHTIKQLIQCDRDTTVEKAMSIIIQNAIHRIYIRDGNKLVACFSMTDFFRFALREHLLQMGTKIQYQRHQD